MESKLIILLIISGVVAYTYCKFIGHIIIYDFQKAMLYRNGKFVKLLGPGKHRYLNSSVYIKTFDIRQTTIVIPGQEVLTKDNVTIKISLAGFYQITDPIKAEHNSENYVNQLYQQIQILLRELVNTYEIEVILEKRNSLAKKLEEKIQEKAPNIGMEVGMLTFRDIMLPSAMKKAFSGIIEAKKESQIQLEKARGEDAVLRKLSNSAKMYEKNPSLLQSRIIQTLSLNKSNTIVFGANENVKILDNNTSNNI